MKELALIDQKKTSQIEQQVKALCSVGRISIKDQSPSTLDMVKTPLLSRIKKSKFNTIIENMTDDDLKLTAYAICFNDSVKEAVKCYHTSVANYVQIAALIKELNERDITINV